MLFGRRKLKTKRPTPALPAQPPGEAEPPTVTITPSSSDGAPVTTPPSIAVEPARPLPPPFMAGGNLPAAEGCADLTNDCQARTHHLRALASPAAPPPFAPVA